MKHALLALLATFACLCHASIKIEADTLTIVRCTSGQTLQQKLVEEGSANEGDFSDDQTLTWIDAEAPGAILELALPVEKAGKYAISLHLGRYRTFGTHQVLINGKAAGKPIDFFGSPGHDIVVPFDVDLGTVVLKEGDNMFALKLTGTNDETIMANHGCCIDWIKLDFKGGTVGSDPDTPDVTPGSAMVFEADSLAVVRRTSGETIKANHEEDGFADVGSFTKDRTLLWHGAEGPGAVLELALPSVKKGLYKIVVHLGKYRTYGIHQFSVNGKPLGNRVDFFGSPGQDIILPFTVTLGTVQLKEGTNRISLRVVSTNRETIMGNYGACIDWIRLEKAR